MRNPFRTVDDVLRSALPAQLDGCTEDTGLTRVPKSTRLEDHIYADLRSVDEQMDSIEAACSPKLTTFPDLSRDLYQSVYSLSVRPNEEEKLTGTAV